MPQRPPIPRSLSVNKSSAPPNDDRGQEEAIRELIKYNRFLNMFGKDYTQENRRGLDAREPGFYRMVKDMVQQDMQEEPNESWIGPTYGQRALQSGASEVYLGVPNRLGNPTDLTDPAFENSFAEMLYRKDKK